MMEAVRVHGQGGPEVLKLDRLDTPEPGPGETLVRVEFSGVNVKDTLQRQLTLPAYPALLGIEGVGVIDAVGPGDASVRVDDRVAWINYTGSYATHAIVPVDYLVPLPAGVESETAAAVMMHAMTAHCLALGAYNLADKDLCLVHGAAGGVGAMIVQLAKTQGAHVIGTVSSKEKAEVARAAGADDLILYTQQDFVAEVKRLTDGRGADVIFDGVGKDTLERDFDCTRRRGHVVLYGATSGEAPEVSTTVLLRKGSLFLTRVSMLDYCVDRPEYLRRASEIFDRLKSGALRANITGRYSLADAGEAHEVVADRSIIGKVVLHMQSRSRSLVAGDQRSRSLPERRGGLGRMEEAVDER